MNNDGQKIVMRGICRPDGAGPLAGAGYKDATLDGAGTQPVHAK